MKNLWSGNVLLAYLMVLNINEGVRYYMLVASSEWTSKIQQLELKSLCSTILEKTIADPDKYQSGLTKIFFRAGMLAALESLRADRLNSLVTIVQKNVRRKLAMKRYQRMRAAAIKIQTWWRMVMAKNFVYRVRQEAAAIRLQSALRRFVQRKQFLDTRTSIILFQSCE
jgi:myosin V